MVFLKDQLSCGLLGANTPLQLGREHDLSLLRKLLPIERGPQEERSRIGHGRLALQRSYEPDPPQKVWTEEDLLIRHGPRLRSIGVMHIIAHNVLRNVPGEKDMRLVSLVP